MGVKTPAGIRGEEGQAGLGPAVAEGCHGEEVVPA